MSEFSGTDSGLTFDILEMYVVCNVSGSLLCIASTLLVTNYYVVRMFLVSSAPAMEIQQEIYGD